VTPNTLKSFQHALDIGCFLVETDVRTTKDGALVLFHDDALRWNGKLHPISTLTLEGLRAFPLPDGLHIPTLEEALPLFRQRGVALLDIKGVGFEQAMAHAVAASGIPQAIVCGEPLSSIMATHAANPAIATSLTLNRPELANLTPAQIDAVPTDMVTVQGSGMTRDLVTAFQARGISVTVWTIDEEQHMRTLLEWGVDGITTNRPDVLLRVLGR
jgi:glycerophosphoryl diester phosphodiesterase